MRGRSQHPRRSPLPRKSTPSLRCHKRSGNGYAYFNRRQVWFGRYDDPQTHQAFAEYLAQWQAAGAGRAHQAPAQAVSIAALVARYLEHAEVYYRRADGQPTGTVEAIGYAVRPLLGLFASTLARDFSVQALKLVRDRMIQDDLARNTINNRISRIVQLFRWGAEEALVPADVYHDLRVLRPLQRGRSRARETTPRRPVARQHVLAVLPHVSRQVAGIVELMWWSGMRPSEAIALRPVDLDRGGALWEYRLRHHKTLHHGQERTVYLGPKAQEVLRPFLQRVPAPDPERPVFSAREAEAERNVQRRALRVTPMKPSDARRQAVRAESGGGREVGDSYTVDSLRRAISRACAAVGVPRWTPHQLRHAAATRIRKEEGVEAAGLVLGHSNLATTEIYAEASSERARKIVLRHG